MAIDADLMVAGMVVDKRLMAVPASPPDFGVSNGNFFFSGQGG